MEEKEKNDIKKPNPLDERLDDLFGKKSRPSKVDSPLSDEDKREIKKSLVIIIWIIVIIGIIMIIVWFVRPFDKKNKTIVNDNNNSNNQVEHIYSSLSNGELNINSGAVQEIVNMYEFNYSNPLYSEIYNVFSDSLVVDDASYETKLFLLSSNSTFNSSISSKIEEYNQDNQTLKLTLSRNSLNTIIKQIYGDNYLLDCEYFYFVYELNSGKDIYFKGSLVDDSYIFEYVETEPIDVKIYTGLIGASKNEVNITLEYSIVYVNNFGIYSDKECKNLLSTDLKMAKYYALTGENYDFNYIFNPETDEVKLNDIEKTSYIVE